MPTVKQFDVVKLERLEETDKGLAFLKSEFRLEINAKQVFDKLKPRLRGDVYNRFDYWIAGNHYDKYFHGFPNDPNYSECFVFKWSRSGAQHRLYGFLANPRLDKGFQVCILVCHGQKPGGDHHDLAKLKLTESLRLNPNVVAEVKTAFLEIKRR